MTVEGASANGAVRRGRRSRRRVALVVLVVAPVIALCAAAAFATLEKGLVSGYWDGLWWALSLMTTVGFVGESPETTGGRLLSAALMLTGFGLITLATAAIASFLVREDEAPEERREHDFQREALERLDALAVRLDALERRLGDGPGGS